MGVQLAEAVRECRQLSGQFILPGTPRASAMPRGSRASDKYCRDLTRRAVDGELDPVFCRDAELDRMVEILCRRQKNNPCLVGEPGVAKRPLPRALPSASPAGTCPGCCRDGGCWRWIWPALVAGTKYRGDFEERLKNSGIGYQLNTTGVEQEDWQNAWKKYYHAMDIGERLAIVPGWEDYRTDRIRIVMDPGMAFGTGTHETTSLCLETLDSLVKGGERVLDIGTGSGILAIAALKLGADSAEGVDIDPVAVRTAGENAALNGVADKLTVLVGDLSDKASGKYDIITANIVANAILSLAPAVPGLMAEGATFIASGIIDSRKDEVIAALEAAGLTVQEVKEKRGWECIVCKKA